MERCIYIKNYRNIGISESERLVINTAFDRAHSGNLVFLVAQNNVGKSNVLDAVEALTTMKFSNDDVTTLTFEDGHQTPEITLCLKGNDETIMSYSVSADKAVRGYIKGDDGIGEPWASKAKEIAEAAIDGIRSYSYYDSLIDTLEKLLEKLSDAKGKEERTKAILEIKACISHAAQTRGNNSAYTRMYNNLIQNFSGIENTFDYVLTKRLNEYSHEHYGLDFIPNVIKYDGASIGNDKLRCSPSEISDFIERVLKLAGCTVEEVKRTYEASKLSTSFLTKLEKKVNQGLKPTSAKFNKLYFHDDDTYTFSIKFETNLISFEMTRNDTPMVLSRQSAGFKWFFALYFNVLIGSNMHPGDILIMDEPANAIHAAGKAELRRFMKEFAVREGIVLLISTHDPFMLDADYYDELRLLKLEGDEVKIHNNFAAVDVTDPDTLSPIKEILTVKSHILNDPDRTPVFVEGITDYNYLVAMRNRLGERYSSLAFVPMHGLGDAKAPDYNESQQAILDKIYKIARRYSPIILVDADTPGKDLKKRAKDTKDLTVITLGDVSENFKQIETLFSPEDAKKLGIIDAKGQHIKSSHDSANFKTYNKDIELSEETIKNFKLLFEKLLEIVE